MSFRSRIMLGDLVKEIALGRLNWPGDCKIEFHLDEDGNKYIQLYDQGCVTTIYISEEKRIKGYTRKKNEV